jgi:hypothetical protein
MQAKVIMIAVVDAATKAVEDQAIMITTYSVLDRALASTETGFAPTARGLAGAISKLVNKVAVSAGTLTVYKTDDTTSLFTQTVTGDATANPIVSVDTV